MIRWNRRFALIFLAFSLGVFLFLSAHIRLALQGRVRGERCDLSRIESDEFFCESDQDWRRRKERFHLQHNRNRVLGSPYLFFQDNYEPTFSCRFERRLGGNGDGGKWLCDVYRLRQSQSCLIYSLGSNGDFSFENETKRLLPHCDIHTFDMRLFNCTEICTFHQMMVGGGVNDSKSLSTIMSELNHTGRSLDILKVDVEGSEYEFFENFFNNSDGLSERIRQILVEVHLNPFVRTVNNVTVFEYERAHDLFRLFHDNHFVIFHKEVNLYNPYMAFEFSFIRLNRQFFEANNRSNATKR